MKEQNLNIENDLLYRYIAGNTNETENKEIENRLVTDSEFKKLYEKIKSIWESAENVKVLNSFDSDAGLLRVKQKIKQIDKQRKTKLYFNAFKIAAVVLLLFGLILILKSSLEKIKDIKMLCFTAKGRQNLILPDSTIVFLNDGATVKYPESFNDTTRNVEFAGEGYFKVKKDAKQPFIIKSEKMKIRVLGTAFYLNSKNNCSNIIVVVTEGKVMLSNQKNESILLQKGDKGEITKTDDRISKQSNADFNYLSSQTGVFDFNNTYLPEALKQLSGYYQIKFDIKNSSLNQLQLSGLYENIPLNELIDILKLTLNVEIEKRDSVFIVK